jgi:hypothetical protein
MLILHACMAAEAIDRVNCSFGEGSAIHNPCLDIIGTSLHRSKNRFHEYSTIRRGPLQSQQYRSKARGWFDATVKSAIAIMEARERLKTI